MNTYREQLWRTGIIGVLLVVLVGAVLALYATGEGEDFRARIEGALLLLVPAFFDTLRVQKKQRRKRKVRQKKERAKEHDEEEAEEQEEDTEPVVRS